jgi:glyoxylase-like metal-dependent hydrolase (beta-lactamase superfamily II)
VDKSKKKKLIIIAAIAVVFLLGAVLLIYPIRSLIAFNSMTPLETGEVIPGVYAVKDQYVNLFVIKSEDACVAIDAGNDTEATKNALDSLGISPADVSVVFLTHTDYDHVGALFLFPQAELYMANSNRIFLEQDEGKSRSKVFIDMAREYNILNDGETVTVADISVSCVFTPGHTDGSACYVIDGKYLFTGDTMKLQDAKAETSYGVFNMNENEQKDSLRKLSCLEGIEAVFTMHSGYTMDFDTAFSVWKE